VATSLKGEFMDKSRYSAQGAELPAPLQDYEQNLLERVGSGGIVITQEGDLAEVSTGYLEDNTLTKLSLAPPNGMVEELARQGGHESESGNTSFM
jgi:hypothetical protein